MFVSSCLLDHVPSGCRPIAEAHECLRSGGYTLYLYYLSWSHAPQLLVDRTPHTPWYSTAVNCSQDQGVIFYDWTHYTYSTVFIYNINARTSTRAPELRETIICQCVHQERNFDPHPPLTRTTWDNKSNNDKTAITNRKLGTNQMWRQTASNRMSPESCLQASVGRSSQPGQPT